MFTCYEDGAGFLRDNIAFLNMYPIETMFFRGNAERLTDRSLGFAVRATDGSDRLIALRYADYSTVLFGEKRLCDRLAEGLVKNNLSFSRVLCEESLSDSFFRSYERLAGGSHRLLHRMFLMKCLQTEIRASKRVERARPSDAAELAELMSEFNSEALGFDVSPDKLLQGLQNSFGSFYVVRLNGVLSCVAQRARETEALCAVTNVFTRREYRGMGLAREVVGTITREIVDSKKTAYLYVDGENPVTNHLYTSLGYRYLSPQCESEYIPKQGNQA